jgi:hypothetical protein
MEKGPAQGLGGRQTPCVIVLLTNTPVSLMQMLSTQHGIARLVTLPTPRPTSF